MAKTKHIKLVDQSEVARLTHLDKLGMKGLAKVLMDVLRISDINELYDRHREVKGMDFIDAIFEDLQLEFDFYEEELKRIPAEGPFITVSNHPLGGIDGLILLRLITRVRPDFKVMANFLLEKVEPLKDYFLGVNPFEDKKHIKSSFAGIKESMEYVRGGHGLGVFPAGEVSTYKFEEGKITDREWQESALKLISKMEVPVIPVYFKARNSRLFYFFSTLSPRLRTARLPSEVLAQRGKNIRIRIGRPVSVEEQREYPEVEELGRFLRFRTYMLAYSLEVDKESILRGNRRAEREKPIADPVRPDLMKKEIGILRQKECLLTSQGNMEVYSALAEDIPSLLDEIGRLREISFREIGEGTGHAFDLDEYDYHYLHLILWDREAGRVAGAYRLCLGKEIFAKFGRNGFYLNTLFRFDKEALPLLEQGIEMGRAFVAPEYQQKPLPLYLLWKGIIYIVLRNPGHRYLTGCVSISNRFSKLSKSLMVDFVRRNYYDELMGRYVHARNPFKVELDEESRKYILEATRGDMNKLDRIIEELEPGNMRIPVLLKKYIRQNARVIAFNVDPKFSNSVDGFMYMDIKDLPEQTIRPVLDELEAESCRPG